MPSNEPVELEEESEESELSPEQPRKTDGQVDLDYLSEIAGTKLKKPSDIETPEGTDRFAHIAKSNSGNKTTNASARAFGSMPTTWKPKATEDAPEEEEDATPQIENL